MVPWLTIFGQPDARSATPTDPYLTGYVMAADLLVGAKRDAKLGQVTSRECGSMPHSSRNTLGVVLAKARTHYPKLQLLRDPGAAIPFITEFGGYGSWLSPGRQ
ncbi:hypothetical protein [Bradyrhizobium sp. CCBAU 53421]|uniref:hypothetical protein n=1 Tax=Bradyrhizobium sp. CCBAU 53421 TaxID=1325120 RepID=UPI00188B0F7E|nr:hypothetical protein [Bradyrhizobium sp. CCBAU 53421]